MNIMPTFGAHTAAVPGRICILPHAPAGDLTPAPPASCAIRPGSNIASACAGVRFSRSNCAAACDGVPGGEVPPVPGVQGAAGGAAAGAPPAG